ncbi:Uu.00g065210.m01.CDS01 [Anthostomella pinea]|uniref:Uu.00g065210.m01.CDS01 n=1 Tax=Anthostomella pinea TaxID=933095 RepID=A0AAI8YNA2_9PEZI|nr:Uu.00g065210.m01.CDS01 [Anthostomella pinea]
MEFRVQLSDAIQQVNAPVFTNCDIQPKSIVIRASDGLPVFTDWEFAGWFPPYWENVVIAERLNQDAWIAEDWVTVMKSIFPEYAPAQKVIAAAEVAS